MTDSRIARYLLKMCEAGASDLYLTYNYPPSLRVENHILPISGEAPLKGEDIDAIIDEILDESQKQELATTFELNVALDSYHKERFRANFFRQQHKNGIVIRRIRTDIPSIESLKLPPIYSKLIMEKRGLILMVGSAGAGKSTSLAAMLNYRNQHGDGHVVTIEDPIEYIYEPRGCIFTQRELGIDTYSYGNALKNALRQSPDVIVIGEIRDRDTMENALLFCETGHLCIATLHANNSSQAIERMVNLFPEEGQRQVLITLSQNLKAIFSQRLVEDKTGHRVLAAEILLNAGLIKKLIEEGKIKEIKELMERNKDQGMQTFDQCLLELYLKGTITADVALNESDNPSNLRLRINQEKGSNPDLKKTSYTAVPVQTKSTHHHLGKPDNKF